MDERTIQRIYDISDKLIREIDCSFHRFGASELCVCGASRGRLREYRDRMRR